MTDFGTDFGGLDDLDPLFSVVTGPAAVRLAVGRRFLIPEESLEWAPDEETIDLREWLGEGLTAAELDGVLRSQVAAVAEADERVDASRVSLTLRDDGALFVSIECATAEGPFTLTLLATAAKVVIL